METQNILKQTFKKDGRVSECTIYTDTNTNEVVKIDHHGEFLTGITIGVFVTFLIVVAVIITRD